MHKLKLLASLLLSSITFNSFAEGAEKPNILMLCVDDMNDWVGFLDGHPQALTPNMDKLAAKGVNFTNAHCTSPGCSPSRNALMFGIEPHNSGLYPFYDIVEITSGELDRLMPMPLHFKNNGYKTVGITKVYHNPDNEYMQNIQWDDYQSFGDSKLKVLKKEGYYPEPYQKRLVACPAENPKEDFRDFKSAKYAKNFLQKRHDKPFFLAVGFVLPHTPFIAPKENFDRFDAPIVAPPIKADDLNDIPLVGQSNAQLYVEIPMARDNAWKKVRRGYLASINFTDDNIGMVMDALEASSYADNTIVILWSDHGFHLGEKRSFSKFSLWEEATRTPFIIWDRRRKGNGQKCDEALGLINVYKTLCDLAGITTPSYVDGISLRPWLDQPSKYKASPAMTTWGRGNYTLRTKKWRYTRYFDGTEELYNKTQDSNEWSNLADNPEYTSLKKEMAQKWLPKKEAPQVKTGIKLYNVADADKPDKAVQSYKRHQKTFKAEGLQPPLD